MKENTKQIILKEHEIMLKEYKIGRAYKKKLLGKNLK